MFGSRIRLEKAFYEQVKRCAAKAGYGSVEEFVRHALEKEMARLEKEEGEKIVDDRLRGLGYIS